jgi:predicted alpha/beta hydrolase family esterase
MMVMTQQILFIHGAGGGAYEADAKLAHSLQNELGSDFAVHCPEMPDEDNAPYDAWKQLIQKKVESNSGSIILVGHSIGASHLVKILAETEMHASIPGIFLIAAPYWGGDGWLYEGYEEIETPRDASKLPTGAKVFLYHARDDEIVPFDHLAMYRNLLPQATVREIDAGGHQMDNDLSVVAKDIKTLDNLQVG